MKGIIVKKEKAKLLPMQVIEELRQVIITNKLKPGDTIPTENELIESLNVSKSSVREAIKMLEAVGVVEIKRGCGTILSESSSKGFVNVLFYQLLMQTGTKKELANFRKMIEIAYTEMAALTITDIEIEELEKNLIEFETKVLNKEISSDDDIQFHRLILRATHNSFIINLGEAIFSLFKEGIEKALEKNAVHALNDHRLILKAIKNKNMEDIRKCIENSVDTWIELL